MRDVILHYHVFKNAGSSVDEWLRLSLGSTACGKIEGDHPRCTIGAEQLSGLALANPGLRAISSHQARMPLPEVDGIRFHPVVFLRHPIDRAGSVYAFERSQTSDAPGARAARSFGFADYVRWRLEPGNGCVIKGFQTLHLSGARGPLETMLPTDAHLADATTRLASLPYFGIVERFADSLRRIAEGLRPAFSMRDPGEVKPVNVSEGRGPGLESRLQRIEEELGPELNARLVEHNRHDLKLYDLACSRFEAETAASSSSA